jgi:hypothetical protein
MQSSAPQGGYAPVQASAPQGGGYAPVPVAAPLAQPGFAPMQQQPPVIPPVPPGAGQVSSGKSGGGALKIILIIVLVFVGLGILGVGAVGFGIWRVAHAVRVSSSGDGKGSVTFHTAGGTFSANTAKSFTADELGIDIYPGASATQGGVRMDVPTGSWITGVFLTSDSKDQVVAYYKDKMGSDAAVMDTGDSAVLTLKKGDKEGITITISQKPDQDQGKTKFAIMHTKSKS